MGIGVAQSNNGGSHRSFKGQSKEANGFSLGDNSARATSPGQDIGGASQRQDAGPSLSAQGARAASLGQGSDFVGQLHKEESSTSSGLEVSMEEFLNEEDIRQKNVLQRYNGGYPGSSQQTDSTKGSVTHLAGDLLQTQTARDDAQTIEPSTSSVLEVPIDALLFSDDDEDIDGKEIDGASQAQGAGADLGYQDANVALQGQGAEAGSPGQGVDGASQAQGAGADLGYQDANGALQGQGARAVSPGQGVDGAGADLGYQNANGALKGQGAGTASPGQGVDGASQAQGVGGAGAASSGGQGARAVSPGQGVGGAGAASSGQDVSPNNQLPIAIDSDDECVITEETTGNGIPIIRLD